MYYILLSSSSRSSPGTNRKQCRVKMKETFCFQLCRCCSFFGSTWPLNIQCQHRDGEEEEYFVSSQLGLGLGGSTKYDFVLTKGRKEQEEDHAQSQESYCCLAAFTFFTKGYDTYLEQVNSGLVLSTEGTACFDPVSSAGKHREQQHSRQDTKLYQRELTFEQHP